MTDQFAPYTPPYTGYQPATLAPGQTIYTWCSECHGQTQHVYKPGTKRPLECVVCHPQKEP